MSPAEAAAEAAGEKHVRSVRRAHPRQRAVAAGSSRAMHSATLSSTAGREAGSAVFFQLARGPQQRLARTGLKCHAALAPRHNFAMCARHACAAAPSPPRRAELGTVAPVHVLLRPS